MSGARRVVLLAIAVVSAAARQDGAVVGSGRGELGRVFNEVPELYDRVRPRYPDEMFSDLVAITGMDERSSVLEVGVRYRSGDALAGGAAVFGDGDRAGRGDGRPRSPTACPLRQRLG